MLNPPQTRPTLLLKIRDAQDHQAWESFVIIYAPLIHGFCMKRGLQDADAADVAQEVLKAVALSIQRFEYEPARGKFRNWLLTVTRNNYNNFLCGKQRRPETPGGTT